MKNFFKIINIYVRLFWFWFQVVNVDQTICGLERDAWGSKDVAASIREDITLTVRTSSVAIAPVNANAKDKKWPAQPIDANLERNVAKTIVDRVNASLQVCISLNKFMKYYIRICYNTSIRNPI